MTIYSTDLKFLAAERMTQNPDGGGRVSAVEILDNVENNVFPDIASGDRIAGRTWLAKLYPAVRSPNRDGYLASRVVLTTPPADPNVSVALFTTHSWTDERVALASYIETFLTAGAVTEIKLLGLHVVGQRAVYAYQRPGAPLPAAGEVYVLSAEANNEVSAQQYVRITQVETAAAAYVDDNGTFLALNLTLTLADPLTTAFVGGIPKRLSSYIPPTVVRKTNAASAARLYGIHPLAVGASAGAMRVQTSRIFTPIVPTTQSEKALLDLQVGGETTITVSGGARSVTLPALAHTQAEDIAIANRQLNYVALLIPKPAPGSVSVSYRAQGKWYTLTDTGDGGLRGPGAGVVNYTTGSVAVTLLAVPDVGSAILWAWGSPVHFSAPDLPTLPVQFDGWALTLAQKGVAPASLTATWTAGGVLKTATANSLGYLTGDALGELHPSTGRVTLRPLLLPDPATSVQVSYAYSGQRTETFAPTKDALGRVTVTLAHPIRPGSTLVVWNTTRYKTPQEIANNTPGDTMLDFAGFVASFAGATYRVYGSRRRSLSRTEWSEYHVAYDNGAGALVPATPRATGPCGTVTYATGVIQVSALESGDAAERWIWFPGQGYARVSFRDTYAGAVAVLYVDFEADLSPQEETLTTPPLTFTLTPYTVDALVPGTIRFTLGTTVYDDVEGAIQHTVNPDTGVGTPAGSIDYQSGDVVLHTWVAGSAALSVQSLATGHGPFFDTDFAFRIPGSPVRPGGFQLAATALDGDLLTADLDLNGNLIGDSVAGTVDVEYGRATVRFGARVLNSSLTVEEKAESWYHPDDVDGAGYIWKPRPVILSTARYNAVSYAYLPLSAALLGLDTVRLPTDGRVQTVHVGDAAMIHWTGTLELPVPVVPGSVHATGKPSLARVWLTDATGAPVSSAHYTADLDAGTVTLAVDLEGSAYTLPLTVAFMVADEALVMDVDVSGTVTLNRPLSRAYPLGSYLSTALRIGDLAARVTVPFSQQAWTSVWSDTRIGSPIAPQYRQVLYPIRTTNDGALQERWRLQFVTATTVDVIGETVGQIAAGLSILTPLAPINPVTGQPYFTMPAEGWGSGWVSGNLLRFNTISADYPVTVLRCVQSGPASGTTDRIGLTFLGDVDA